MKLEICAAVITLALAVHGFAESSDTGSSDSTATADTNRLAVLVKQMGAGDHKSRTAAEAELSKCPRSAIDFLKSFLDSDDPEIQIRVRDIIQKILADPARIPTSCYVFASKSADQSNWTGAMNEWRAKAKVAVSNEKGESATTGSFAQSFVPKCDTIKVIELATYPVNADTGWIKADLCADDNGKPGRFILGRCWILVEKNCPVPHGGMMPFVFPSVSVDPKKKYWVCYTEFPVGSNRTIVNYQFSIGNQYKDGEWLRGGTSELSDAQDVLFRVLPQCGAVPDMKPASKEEIKTLPAQEIAEPWW